MPQAPQLIFFCELAEPALLDLFDDDSLIPTLQKLGAGVGMGILDLSKGRAQVVKRLNDAGIPVVAWLLLPHEQGYWFNINNTAQARTRYFAFKAWTCDHALVWDGVGLDIEPDRREIDHIMHDALRGLLSLLKRAVDYNRFARARAVYTRLVRQIKTDGYRVDAYHLPFLVDERAMRSTFIQRILGLVAVPADREVLMLYTSFFGPWGVGALWGYGQQADYVAVGSTGGGVEIGDLPKRVLSWEELGRDLRLAAQLTNTVHIFSLEGAVKQGYLQKLVDFDWSVPVSIDENAITQYQQIRGVLRGVLWVAAHIRAISISLAGVLVMGVLLRRFSTR